MAMSETMRTLNNIVGKLRLLGEPELVYLKTRCESELRRIESERANPTPPTPEGEDDTKVGGTK